MGELILHIGTRKTGTTALQKFFVDNREALMRNGVDYTRFTPQKSDPYSYSINGVFLRQYCRALVLQKEIDNLVSDFKENYERLVVALKGDNRVLLSDENLSAFFNQKYESQYNPEKYWREMARIVKELGARQITIIVYLRRQDEYVVSSWKERVKGGWTDKPFREYLNDPDREYELNYKILLDAIQSAFGSSAKIIVRSYNQVAYSGIDIFHDFCDSLGIAWDSDYIIPKRRLNEAISFDMAEALLKVKLGKPGRSRDEKRVRKNLAVALCRNQPDPKGTTIFLPGEAESLMKQYSDGNRRISEVYFDNKNLFSEEYNEGPNWHPNKFRITWYRIVLTVISILSQMSLKANNGFRVAGMFIKRLRKKRDAY